MAKRERGLFKRGDIWWISYGHQGTTHRESSHSASEKVARDLRNKRISEMRENKLIGPSEGKLTVATILANLVTHYETKRKASLGTVKGFVKAWKEVLGERSVLRVTPAELEAISLRWKNDGYSAASINRRVACLRRAYKLAVQQNLTNYTPATFPHEDESDSIRQGFVEPADFRRVLAEIQDPDVRDLAEWCGTSGMRKGEASKLEWKHVHEGELRIPGAITKNRAGRVIPLVAVLKPIIDRRRKVRRLDCPFVFHRNGGPVKEFRKSWRSACKRAGFPELLFHDLRRSAVRNLVRAGLTPDVARAISGHKTPSIFSRYNIISTEDMAAGLEKLTAYLDQASESKVAVIK
jgi:integrase